MSKPTIPRRPGESYTARYKREQGESDRAKPGDAQRRINRTIIAASILVLVVLIWMIVDLGADRDEVVGFVGTSVLFVAAPLALGIVVGALVIGVKAWRYRSAAKTRSPRN